MGQIFKWYGFFEGGDSMKRFFLIEKWLFICLLQIKVVILQPNSRDAYAGFMSKRALKWKGG